MYLLGDFTGTKITDEEAYEILKNGGDVGWYDKEVNYHRLFPEPPKDPMNHGYMMFYKFPDIIRFYWMGKKLS